MRNSRAVIVPLLSWLGMETVWANGYRS